MAIVPTGKRTTSLQLSVGTDTLDPSPVELVLCNLTLFIMDGELGGWVRPTTEH